jgi:lipid II:glycine glycyltransferase (peptidoglycan interpeptide bridge formation enzyme)
MEVRSLLTGKRAVSLPFTDECHLINQNNDQFQSLLKDLISYGKQAGWKHIEFRGENQFLRGYSTYTHHFTHTLALAKDEKKIFSSFKSNVKRNIKKAPKESVKFALSNTWTTMRDFCRLNCMTRKEHGLPPQPLSFFRKIFDHIIAPQHGFVALAVYQAKPVAGAVYFHHAGNAIYKYGASDRKYQKLRPNNLVMWEAIKWYCRNGYKTFSFGRTESENQGLLQFKRGWGTEEKIINYYKYDFAKDVFVRANNTFKSSYNLFKIMPLPFLRLTGNLFYRHVG